MQFSNNVIIAAAGSGKTTRIVQEVLNESSKKALIVTYTLNNVGELKKKFYEYNKCIPQNVTVVPWFTFLLHDFVRPYQNVLYDKRINSIAFVNGKSTKGIPKDKIVGYFINKGGNIYNDKISEFSGMCNMQSGGLVLDRLQSLYENVYIDEVQDLAGYDLELLEILLRSEINVTLVGDHRQATFQTNYSQKNKKYSGPKIIDKFLEWESQGFCSIEYLKESFRCNQNICDLADGIYSDFPKTLSKNKEQTGHDGVFVLSSDKTEEYLNSYKPQILRYDKTTKCGGHRAINFGDSKGLTFDRVLIFPHGPVKKLLETGDFKHVEKSAAKLYVGITRAKYSVTFVYDGQNNLDGIVRI